MPAEGGVVGIYLPSFNAPPVFWWGHGTPERGVCLERQWDPGEGYVPRTFFGWYVQLFSAKTDHCV